jgi:ribosomal protein S18 acetylase RimI-like enzyme
MNTTLVFREAGIADTNELIRLGLLSYGQFKTLIGEENWKKMSDHIKSVEKLHALLNISKCFVCLDGTKMVGMAHLVPSGNPWEMFLPEWSYIRMVGVDPEYEGRGIAQSLTQMCVDHAKKNKEKIIALHTSEFMDAARHIYEKAGFKKIQELEPRYGKKYWLYTIEL